MTVIAADHAALRAERLRAAESVADGWPLTTTYDLGSRAAPDGSQRAGWAIHVRCGRPDCAQSVLSASNDSGAFVWSIGGELRASLLAHIKQCHREAINDQTA